MTDAQLLEIGIQKRNKLIQTDWNDLVAQYCPSKFKDGEGFRCWVKRELKKIGKLTSREVSNVLNNETEQLKQKSTTEIHKDGSQSSDRFIEMQESDSKDILYLLKAHGYDANVWELVSARSNIWNSYSKKDGKMNMYASKITVKPRVDKSVFSIEKLIESFKQLEPIDVKIIKTDISDKKLLEIPLYDAHFGVSDYEYYKKTQERVFQKISLRKWEEILFVIGQDMLHNDNFRGQTSSGTFIESVDMEKAWNDCKKFYEPLIKQAIVQSNSVKIMYAKGNHDEAMSWAFVQLLKVSFPEAIFDDSMIERKAHVFGDNFIGVTHGDKARKNLHNLFPVEFPDLWSKAKYREVHMGHLHQEDAKDVFGMMIRTLCTRNKTDKWHKDNGFVGAHKRFMLFEYSVEELDSIHYV